MKKVIVFLLFFGLCCCGSDNEPTPLESIDRGRLNLDFEVRSVINPSLPDSWHTGGSGFNISLDDQEKHSGLLSLKMEKPNNRDGNFGVFSSTLPIETFAGKNVEYKGWIKTQGVTNGYAGLWIRVDGADNTVLGFDNMNNRGLTGDNKWTQVSIILDISRNAVNINFGGLFPGEGIAWFDKLELYIDGVKYIDPEPKTSLSEEEITALKKYVYPLRTCEPDGGDTKDLEVLDKLIGSRNVIALGEVSHGSSEIFKMKNRIIQYLVTNNDFDIFSIEAAMPEAYKLNDYTIRGEGNPIKLIWGMYFWTWSTEEMLNMVEWMHQFNRPKQRILYTGFDMQAFEGAVNEFFEAFQGNEEVENKITVLKEILYGTRVGNININDDKMKELEAILSFLQNSIGTSSFQIYEKEWLQQNITVIRQYLGNNTVNNWRDKCMAENFMWIKEHNPDSRFVIWAHNMHIMKTSNMMGFHLAQKLGDDYTTFGFTFFNGRFTAVGSSGLASFEAAKAYAGTLEYFLNQLNEPIFILDLKKIKTDNSKDTKWILEQMHYRRVGSMGGLGVQGEFQMRKISDDFDYLIFIKSSTPSTLLSNSQ